MTTFNNSSARKEADKVGNWTWAGDTFSPAYARSECARLTAEGKRAFYKKAREKYTIYTF